MIPSMESISPIIKVDGLTLAYGNHLVLEDVSFEVQRGKCLVVMGGSGCGKSTLLKSLVGLLEPSVGKIEINSRNLWAGDKTDNSILKEFGVLFQGGALWSAMTIKENVSLPLEIYTDLEDQDIDDLVRYKLSLVGLSGFEDFYPSEISGGMKKRAGLARAMALDPNILFFDEPSAGLDPITSRRLDDLITELKESLGITFVVVTHELASIFEIADDSIFLDAQSKSLLDQGKPDDLVKNSRFVRITDFLKRSESSTS
ncbi:ATP-binding cassette domain-containing protein [Opitutales bacterium]|nr:ATP-binding cassette domain-containing protein [Opitutales bacterium]